MTSSSRFVNRGYAISFSVGGSGCGPARWRGRRCPTGPDRALAQVEQSDTSAVEPPMRPQAHAVPAHADDVSTGTAVLQAAGDHQPVRLGTRDVMRLALLDDHGRQGDHLQATGSERKEALAADRDLLAFDQQFAS